MGKQSELQARIRRFKEDLAAYQRDCVHERAYSLLASAGEIYHPEAQRIWEERLESSPHDHVAVHHLAVLHHARAYDLENEGKDEAFEEWEKALRLWAGLWGCDAFWTELKAKGRQLSDLFNDNKFDESRNNLPRFLLQVHYSLVLSLLHGDIKRAKRHWQLLLNSPFPAEEKEGFRAGLYQNMTAGVDEDRRQRQYQSAVTKLKDFLELDPTYVPPLLRDLVATFNDWNNFLWLDGKRLADIERNLEDAKDYVKSLESQRPDKDPLAAAALAEHYLMTGLVEQERPRRFERALKNGRPPTAADCEEAIRDFNKAVEAYKTSARFDGGLRTRKQTNCLKNAYDWLCAAYIYHAQARLLVNDLTGARKSLREAERIAEREGFTEALEAIKKLEQIIGFI